MNERIKELYEQAREEKPLVTLDPATFEQIHHDEMIRLFNPEKFAELIIRECIDVCEQTHDTSNGKMRCANDDESIRIIKERFGIEL